MQKKSKTILTAVLTALLVLSVGYFALLAPTTAWYYQKEDKSYDFTFGNFSMTPALQSNEQQIATIDFRGTTRFADKGETLFDEMLHIIRVNATNSGDSNGSVRITVKHENENHELVELPLDNANGLRWFVYEEPASGSTETVKAKIDAMLTAWNHDWPIDYNTLTGSVQQPFTDYNQVNGQAETAYETYNGDATDALVEYNKRGVTVQAGETKGVYIAFWVEYGAAKGTLGVGSSASARTTPIPTLTFSNLTIEIKAMPDIGGTGTTKLKISAGANAAASVKLYYWTNNWTLYTDSTHTTGVFEVAANSTTTIADLPVGARFKLELQGASPTVHFTATATADIEQDVNDAGTVITGTLYNGKQVEEEGEMVMNYDNNTVSIEANASS